MIKVDYSDSESSFL